MACPAAAGPVGGGVDAIVVTAQKIPEPIQQAPLSVLAFSAADLERGSIQDFEDLAQIAPSLTISKTTQPANNSINIRGIGTYAFSIAVEPSVAVVVDDIPQAFQAAAFTALPDVQQVEILRGPQNTLFGKASSAGLIKITTAPVSERFSGRLQVTQTDDHERRLQTSLSGPLSSTLGYRLSVNYSDFRGTLYNLTTGHWLNGQEDLNVRGKLEWRPTPQFSLAFSPFLTRTWSTCCAAAETFVPNGATTGGAATGPSRIPASIFLAGVTPGPDNRNLRMDVDARGDARHNGAGLRAEYQKGGLTFLSLSSYEDYRLSDLQDTDSTDIDFSRYQALSPPGGSANGGAFKVSSQTQEFRVSSDGDARLQFTTGLFWSRTLSKRTFVRGSNTLDDYNVTTPEGGAMIASAPSRLPTTNDTTYSRYQAVARSESLALFGQGSLAVSSKLDILAGLRLSRDQLSYTFRDQGNNVAFGSPRCASQTPSGISIETCTDADSVSGRFGVRIKPQDNLMLFATYSPGRKAPAYDLSSTLTLRSAAPGPAPYAGKPLADVIAARQPIPAETAQNYEIGFKSVLFDDAVTLNATLYFMRFENFQAQSRDLLLAQNVLNSVGEVSSRGVEVEASGRVGTLLLKGAAAYNKARIEEFPNASCYRGQTPAEGCAGGVQNLAGRTLPNAPEWSLSAQSEYSRRVSDRIDAFATLAYRWQSAVNQSLLRDPAARQPAYGILNAAAGLRTDAWSLTLFANNIFDQRYLFNGGRDAHINNPPGAFATNWRPAREAQRSLGVRLSYAF